MSIETINPATARKIRSYAELSPSRLESELQRAQHAAREWATTDFPARAAPLRRCAELLRARKSALARLMAEEMGKPLPQGEAEAEKCAMVCEYYASHAEALLAPELVPMDEARASFVTFRPMGLVLAIMPWNFPLWQVFRFLAPAFMAGNGALLKHAPNVQGCAEAIGDLLRDAGLAEGVFTNLVIDVPQVKAVIEHPAVAAVALTGSTGAGKAVAAQAGAALKKTVLELGGSDPYVVLEDADVALAAETCVASRLINGGQSCIAAKRFVVVEPVRAEFTERVVELMREKTMGDPLGDAPIDLGPMARHDLRDSLHDQVRRAVEAGSKLLLGGRVPDGPGAYYPPTVLADVRRGTPAFAEETFGPVAAIVPAKDEDEALSLANDSVYGLGAALFTRDAERGERLATEMLEAGCCFVNDLVRSDPRLPFGGIKQSGYGRELAEFGIREFVNVKSVYVRS